MNFPQPDTAVVSLRLLYNVFIRNIRIFETVDFVFKEHLSCTVAVCRYIVHDNLWYKLLNLGVQGKIIDIIRSMYSQVRTKVFNNNEKSETFTCKLGVTQGECLSPFLFSMYVNDLESHLAGQGAGVSIFDVKFLLLLYADDVVIFFRYTRRPTIPN